MVALPQLPVSLSISKSIFAKDYHEGLDSGETTRTIADSTIPFQHCKGATVLPRLCSPPRNGATPQFLWRHVGAGRMLQPWSLPCRHTTEHLLIDECFTLRGLPCRHTTEHLPIDECFTLT